MLGVDAGSTRDLDYSTHRSSGYHAVRAQAAQPHAAAATGGTQVSLRVTFDDCDATERG